MKIQLLLIGLILLSGCTDGICKIFNGEDYIWKEECRKEETNQTENFTETLNELRWANKPDAQLKLSIIQQDDSKPYIRINCKGYIKNNWTNKDLQLELESGSKIFIDIVKLCGEAKQ